MSRLSLAVAALLMVCQNVSFADVPQLTAEEASKFRNQRQAHYKRTVLDIYEKSGNKNPRWDSDATKALEAICRFYQLDESYWDSELAYIHATKAVKAGCTDPFVKYLRVRMQPAVGYDDGLPNNEIPAYYVQVAAEMQKSKYPAFRKAIAQQRAYSVAHNLSQKTPQDNEKLIKGMDSILKLIPDVAKNKDSFSQMDAFDFCRDLVSAYNHAGMSRKEGLDKVMKVLERDPGSKKLALLLKGFVYIDYAWDARGNGLAATVSEEGWKDFAERLKVAETSLEEAWKLKAKGPDPMDSKIAENMLTVELGQGQGRERMDLWFERAMTSNPDNTQACLNKMRYLEPRWHGTPEDMIAFGRECFKTQNWEYGRLPLLLMTAHVGIAERLAGDGYYRRPEVQKDIKAVYDTHLQKEPNDQYNRTFYIQRLVKMRDTAEAQKQLAIMGDNYSRRAFTPKMFDALKHELNEHLGNQKGKIAD